MNGTPPKPNPPVPRGNASGKAAPLSYGWRGTNRSPHKPTLLVQSSSGIAVDAGRAAGAANSTGLPLYYCSLPTYRAPILNCAIQKCSRQVNKLKRLHTERRLCTLRKTRYDTSRAVICVKQKQAQGEQQSQDVGVRCETASTEKNSK